MELLRVAVWEFPYAAQPDKHHNLVRQVLGMPHLVGHFRLAHIANVLPLSALD